MIYDIILFENIRFRPFTRKREASVIETVYSGECFKEDAFWVTVLTEYVWSVASFAWLRHVTSEVMENECSTLSHDLYKYTV